MQKKIKILLIEDDADDIELLQEALHNEGVLYDMVVKTDGGAAIEYIQNCTNCPDVIVLDYNLPKVHGREVLKEIKAFEIFKETPVLILTTSSSLEDREFSKKLGAAEFLVKPATLQEIKTTVQIITTYAD